MENAIKSYILVGLKHSGKSTLGKLLAQKMQVDFFDADEVLQEMTGLSPRDYYAKNGVVKFMFAEEEACKKIAEQVGNKAAVVATGGGICDNHPALNELQAIGNFVFLKLDMEYSIARIMKNVTIDEDTKLLKNLPSYIAVHNPTTIPEVRKLLQERFTERFSHYSAIADVIVQLKNAPIEENFKSLIGALEIK